MYKREGGRRGLCTNLITTKNGKKTVDQNGGPNLNPSYSYAPTYLHASILHTPMPHSSILLCFNPHTPIPYSHASILHTPTPYSSILPYLTPPYSHASILRTPMPHSSILPCLTPPYSHASIPPYCHASLLHTPFNPSYLIPSICSYPHSGVIRASPPLSLSWCCVQGVSWRSSGSSVSFSLAMGDCSHLATLFRRSWSSFIA